jgi:hypothetical protein
VFRSLLRSFLFLKSVCLLQMGLVRRIEDRTQAPQRKGVDLKVLKQSTNITKSTCGCPPRRMERRMERRTLWCWMSGSPPRLTLTLAFTAGNY